MGTSLESGKAEESEKHEEHAPKDMETPLARGDPWALEISSVGRRFVRFRRVLCALADAVRSRASLEGYLLPGSCCMETYGSIRGCLCGSREINLGAASNRGRMRLMLVHSHLK